SMLIKTLVWKNTNWWQLSTVKRRIFVVGCMEKSFGSMNWKWASISHHSIRIAGRPSLVFLNRGLLIRSVLNRQPMSGIGLAMTIRFGLKGYQMVNVKLFSTTLVLHIRE